MREKQERRKKKEGRKKKKKEERRYIYIWKNQKIIINYSFLFILACCVCVCVCVCAINRTSCPCCSSIPISSHFLSIGKIKKESNGSDNITHTHTHTHTHEELHVLSLSPSLPSLTNWHPLVGNTVVKIAAAEQAQHSAVHQLVHPARQAVVPNMFLDLESLENDQLVQQLHI